MAEQNLEPAKDAMETTKAKENANSTNENLSHGSKQTSAEPTPATMTDPTTEPARAPTVEPETNVELMKVTIEPISIVEIEPTFKEMKERTFKPTAPVPNVEVPTQESPGIAPRTEMPEEPMTESVDMSTSMTSPFQPLPMEAASLATAEVEAHPATKLPPVIIITSCPELRTETPKAEITAQPTAEPHSNPSQTENILSRLELIEPDELSEQELAALDAFAHGISPATPEAAAEAARMLDKLCPAPSQTEEVNNWLYTTWMVMIDVAASADASEEIRERLICILESLTQCAKGNVKVWGKERRLWRDLPVLPISFEPYFSADPTMAWEAKEVTPESSQNWRNISSFAARLMGAGLAGAYDQAMYALKAALEEEPSTKPGFAECRMLVACSWIKHAGVALLRWALKNPDHVDVPEDSTPMYLRGGSLYHGPSTVCLQRWGFWIERLEKLGKEESVIGEEARKAALEAVEIMREVEKRIGNTL